MIAIVDLGPRPDDVVDAVRTVLDVGARRAADLVEMLPAYLGVDPALEAVLREELERAGAVVEDREPPAAPPTVAGDVSVLLVAAGGDKVRVAKLLRLATGVTLAEAKRLADAAPTRIMVPARAAAALRRDLAQAGAQVD